MDHNKSYREALEWIHGLSRFGNKPGLERVTAMLEELGRPQDRLRFVHIAGTNGKGSTAAMLASIMRDAGYRTGLYTSPYLLSFSNRMAINGRDIGHEELVGLVEEVRPLVERISTDSRYGHPTEFEVVTVLALTYFAREKVDLVVLEVGLGGRLDATNVVTPLLSVITNVSLEHTEVLGDTVAQVAREKAGIIKEEVPVITAADDSETLAVIEDRAAQLGSSLYYVKPLAEEVTGKDLSVPYLNPDTPSAGFSQVSVNEKGQEFSYLGFTKNFGGLFIPLRGSYQVTNAATALAAAELLVKQGYRVEEESVRRGFATVEWPGRLELLQTEPMLVMDGAHNPAAVTNLAGALPEYFNYRRLILVFGIMADKDSRLMLENILPLADKVIFTRALIPRAEDPRALASEAVHQLGWDPRYIEVFDDIGMALEKGLELAGNRDMVLVSGSFYTVSDARAYWEKNMR